MARKQVGKIVVGFDKKDHADTLNRWIRFPEHGAQVILLEVPTVANAYKKFETLNDRGLTSWKFNLFGQAGDRISDVQQKCARMKSSLESLDKEDITVTFLRQAMITIRGHLRERGIWESIGTREGAAVRRPILYTAWNYGATCEAIFNLEYERWNTYPNTIRRAIQALNLLHIKSCT